MPKYVIQEHTIGGKIHWDLMLEFDEVLKTYRLNLEPQQLSINIVLAEKIFDHPMRFLTYQGPVNKGKGNVRIVDAGVYQMVTNDEEESKIEFNGKVLNGLFILEHIDKQNWQFKQVTQS